MGKKYLLRIILSFGIFLLAFTLSSCPGGEVSSVILGNKINNTVDKITWGLDRSIANGDYRLEKNLRTLQIITQSIQSDFNKEMSKNRNFVSEEMTKTIDKIDLLIDQSKGGILDVEDFLVLDIQNVINQLPFKKDLYLIRKIDGYGTGFKESGFYEYTIIGNAFQPNKFYEIYINDAKISENNVSLKSANQIGFTIPVSKLNKNFLDFAVTRAKLKIVCYEKKQEAKSFFEFNGEILLLPKFPVSYKFTEFTNRPRWSEQKYYKQFSFDLGPTGEKGKWDSVGRDVSVDDPQTQKFTKVISRGTSGSHTAFGEEYFTPDNKTYHLNIANQCHDCSRTFFGTLEYTKLENYTDLEKRIFDSDSNKNGLLTYGFHSLTLNEKHQLFELAITFFNGQEVFLNKDIQIDKANGCKITISKSENEILKRVTLSINPI